MRVVATAGHVDHGKSALILALTGTDPDRLPEEKARGLTIDLGFAFTDLSSGTSVGFVDVPGHVRFVKNMLAGVGSADMALLVVAATEGWMPQTEEHLRILDVLGVRHGLVVLAKRDLVDDETAALARLEVEEHVAATVAEGWDVIEVDSRTGRGVDEVRRALEAVIAAAPPPLDVGRPRLWVDRVFAARGAGTVVTGTLTAGSLTLGDDVEVVPAALPGRVRVIETGHERVESAAAGSRVALNLAGIDHDRVRRGDAVVRPGEWLPVTVADLALTCLPGAEIPRRGSIHAYVGSGEQRASLRVLDDDGRFGRLRLLAPAPLAPGDRLVLRSSARRATVGGGEVLDTRPARRTADAIARLTRPLPERLVASGGWQTVGEIARAGGVNRDQAEEMASELTRRGVAVRLDRWIVDAEECARLRARVHAAIDRHDRDHPDTPGMGIAALGSLLRVDSGPLRALLDGDDSVTVDREMAFSAGSERDATADPRARQFLDALDAAPYAPPAPRELGIPPGIVRALERDGRIVALDGTYFSAAALDSARAIVGRAVTERGSLTVSAIRDLLGSTRRFALPIANWLDREGVTRRRGDDRIPGPRAPAAAEPAE
jgi:selenocysteine-specific elongation factor